MPYTSRHLVLGENPPSPVTQDLANTLPPWTVARSASLPSGPQSLTAVQALTYSAQLHGSHWQRFMNAFGIELELARTATRESIRNRYLDFSGWTNSSLDIVSTVALPAASTVVLGVSATTSPSQTIPTAVLTPVNRLYDFYYGLSFVQEATATAGQTSFTLPHRVGVNSDHTHQVEWVLVNGTEVTNYSVDPTGYEILLGTPCVSGDVVSIHYTTYDIYYIVSDVQQNPPICYFRYVYPTVFVSVSGSAPLPTTLMSPGLGLPAPVVPNIHMLWNELDECGLLLDKARLFNETNYDFQQRLIDATLYPLNPTNTGLRNALAVELGLIPHGFWGPQTLVASATANINSAAITSYVSQNIPLPSTVDPTTILVDRLPLPYYTVVSAASASGAQLLNFPGLDPGATATLTLQVMATGGSVVPGQVPLRLTHTAPSSALATYDDILVLDPDQLISAPSAPWYPGSLLVWKNGVPLTPNQDFIELSTTAFSLASVPAVGDHLQLSYIYDSSLGFKVQESQPDFQTDLAPALQLFASYQADPIPPNAELFPNYKTQPYNTDPQALPPYATWTITLVATNVGSASGAPFSVTVQLPPQIQLRNGVLSIDDLSQVHTLRYIDEAVVSVNNLSDPSLFPSLYDAEGRGTPLLRNYAAQITNAAPLQFGQISWDRAYWQTQAQRYANLSFIPNLLDSQYEEVLPYANLLFTGSIVGASAAAPLSNVLFGTSLFGFTVFGSVISNSPFFINATAVGDIVGEANLKRYTGFVSGIGDLDDLTTSIAMGANVSTAMAASGQSALLQHTLRYSSSANTTFTIPSTAYGAWWVTISPGTFYLNQEEHYFFSSPVYAEAFDQLYFMPGAIPGSMVVASAYDLSGDLLPMRRVYFLDPQGNLTLTNTETIQGDGSNILAASYAGLTDIVVTNASDGGAYTATATASGNSIMLNRSTAAQVTVNYALTGSFIVVDSATAGGAYFYMEQRRPDGVLLTYESGAGSNITNLPVHPYYNTRDGGFVYLTDNFYVPSKIKVWVDPQSVEADGTSLYTVKVQLLDAYGSGTGGLPVQILVGLSGGSLSWEGNTDAFGRVYADFQAPTVPQLATISASMTIYDTSKKPLQALSSQTFVEFYSPYM